MILRTFPLVVAVDYDRAWEEAVKICAPDTAPEFAQLSYAFKRHPKDKSPRHAVIINFRDDQDNDSFVDTRDILNCVRGLGLRSADAETMLAAAQIINPQDFGVPVVDIVSLKPASITGAHELQVACCAIESGNDEIKRQAYCHLFLDRWDPDYRFFIFVK